MIIVLRPEATTEEKEHIISTVEECGLETHLSEGSKRTIIGVIGEESRLRLVPLEIFRGVEKTLRIMKPYKKVSREMKCDPTVVTIGDEETGSVPFRIGGGNFAVIGGPCSVESRERITSTAAAIKAAGGDGLRGGAYKPRTSPYSFQGHGKEGLEMLAAAREETGLPIVTEVMDTRNVELVAEYADCLQIGTRNMQNFPLLKEAGSCGKPVLLKRGLSSTVEELLLSAEYISSGGGEDIILCERGIRTFEKAYRNTADLSAIPLVHDLSHLPIIFDPSHALGISKFVPDLSLAAIAAGADGLIVEVHLEPEKAWSDGAQALDEEGFSRLMRAVKRVREAVTGAGSR